MEADQHVRPGSRQGNQALVVDLHETIAARLAQRVTMHGQLREHRQIGTASVACLTRSRICSTLAATSPNTQSI